MASKELVTTATKTIRAGSKSFSAAGLLLPKEAREGAYLLYSWCRYTDDMADEDTPSLDRETAIDAFEYIFDRYEIPSHYARELQAGMEMDNKGIEYETLDDLMHYCYRVAGVVGLMMSHIIGVSDEKAMKNACDMGMAMQLTNISRDIIEDLGRGRVYIPHQWLREMNLKREDISNKEHWPKVYLLVLRLLNKADELYASGDRGLEYLHPRVSLSIRSARLIYSEIGQEIRRRGPKYFERRTVTTVWTKVKLIFKSLTKFRFRKFVPAKLQQVFLFEGNYNQAKTDTVVTQSSHIAEVQI